MAMTEYDPHAKITLIRIGMSTSDLAAGAADTYRAIDTYLVERDLDIPTKTTGSLGACHREPLVEVVTEDNSYLYGPITPDRVRPVLDQHLGSDTRGVSPEWVVSRHADRRDYPFLGRQVRVTTQLCGLIDPYSLDDYLAYDGYKGLEKALSLSPVEVIQMIKDSKLRGRGGAGYPAGLKWQFLAEKQVTPKYFICNADEGDPGAFMDRAMIEGDPHRLLEGLLIAAYATGVETIYIYIRAEYPLAVKALRNAIGQITEQGIIGPDAANGFGRNVRFIIKEGAGAFVCGEETALIASVEGERGMPRKRPPFPAISGLWKKPTNINNVETWANIPWIILNGAEAYAKYGTEKSKGTKVFALAGKINHSGLVEVPMGITIRDIIYKLGGGIPGGKKFKAVQLGGPSGGCIPEYLADTMVDYDSVNATGAIMGSGGMVVMDEDTCMVDVARFFLHFTQEESCGKCTFCRIGTKRMLEILERITEGKGKIEDLDTLTELAEQIKNNSLCGLGQTAPNPVLTTIKYFKDEYTAHILEKKCPAKVCKNLLTYEIIPEKCTGCTVCAKKCPVNAISGERKKLHVIDQEACIKCGDCYNRCKFDAIILL